MNNNQTVVSRKLIRYGILLFLLGLLTGFAMPAFENSRMGLSSHLEGVMNGMFLVLLGLIWEKLILSEKLLKITFILALFGTFVNWLTTLFAAIVGAGSEMMPIAGEDLSGNQLEELLIKFGLITLSVAMVVVSIIVLYGLKSDNSSNEMK
ncbi:MAG: hydrogenase [Melioribacteraceae bacterium]|nr:hydrogenase [Melioribacteraceae bacterium]